MYVDWEPVEEQPCVSALVNVDDIADPAKFMEIATDWLNAATETLLPDWWERMQHGDKSLDSSLSVTPYVDGPIRTAKFSPDRWSTALELLDRHPENIGFSATDSEGSSISVDISYSPDIGMRLESGVAAPIDSPTHTRWLAFLVGALKGANPSYGEAGTDGSAGLSTVLDEALKRHFDESILAARRVLRGYSWVTVIPDQLVSRVGGIDILEQSGALSAIYPLAAGGVLLQATAGPFEYDDHAMNRLFRILAPILPSGQPRPGRGPMDDFKVVYEDASLVR